ncbi:hypothetical protein EVAR_44446_1 [Eumeta japonica]|uniref:Uncharacterized protein n=1 Tax=Eumeta variegata TaxID=151549 RepID=A0A4C1WJP2_EUMVA|nr:hypothetical protein EVAR_44446_1 [Eumeta japonica]
MTPTVSQNKFLGNDANKNRLIGMLKTKFEAGHFMVKQATEDADTCFENNSDLNEVIEVFKNPNVDPEVIAKAGERFLIALYSYSDVKSRKSTSLNNYRYACFKASAYKRKFNIASLPPKKLQYDNIRFEFITKFSSEHRDETDDPIADDAEETSVFDIPTSTEDNENTTLFSVNYNEATEIERNFEIVSQMWLNGDTTVKKRGAFST